MQVETGFRKVSEFFGNIYSQTCLGIDFSASPIQVALLSRKKIIQVQSIDIPNIVDSNNRVLYTLTEEEIDMLIVEQLKGIVTYYKITSDNVCVGIPRNLTVLRVFELPVVSEEQLADLMKYEIGRHIPFNPDETYFDTQILRKTDSGTMKVLLVAAQRSKIDRYTHIVEEAGLTPSFVDITSFGTFNALCHLDPPVNNEPLVLIDLKKDNYELTLLEGQRFVFSRSIPFQAHENLSQSFRGEIRRSYISIGGASKSNSCRKMVLSGNIGVLENPEETIRDALGIDVEILKPDDTQIQDVVSPGLAPYFNTAMGLALRGLITNPLQVNLLPLSKRIIRKNYNLYVSLILGIILVGLLVFSFSYGFFERWSVLKELNQKISELEPQVTAIKKLELKNIQIEDQIKEFTDLIKEDFSLLDILRELTLIIPDNTWVNSMQIRNKKLSISGYSESPEDLPGLLDSSPFFDEVKMVQIVNDRFTIEAVVKGSAADQVTMGRTGGIAESGSQIIIDTEEQIQLSGEGRGVYPGDDLEDYDKEPLEDFEEGLSEEESGEQDAESKRPARNLSGQAARGKKP